MNSGRLWRGIFFHLIMGMVFLGAGVYLVWSLRPLILPIIIGILLAYLFRPLRTAFRYRWLPNGARVTLIFSIIFLSIFSVVRFVQENIPNEKEKLEILVRLKYKFNEKFEKMMDIDPTTGKGNTLYSLIERDVTPLRASLNKSLDLNSDQKEAFLHYYNGVEGFEPVSEKYYGYYLTNTKQTNLPALPKTDGAKSASALRANEKVESSGDQSFIKTLIGILSIWFLMPIVLIFFLLDDGAIPQFFIRMVPNRYFELALTVMEAVDQAIGKYLRGISMECGLVAITMMLGLWFVGVPLKMSLLIAILAGLATAIPLVGPIVGLSLGMTYALIAEESHPLLTFLNLDHLLISVLIVNVVVIVLDNIVFQPIVLGSAVNLHPLAVILGIMSASMLFGPAGVLLAIPTIVVTKAVIQNMYRGLKSYRII